MDDNIILSFGKYKGKTLDDVVVGDTRGAGYLLWLYKGDNVPAEVKKYIEHNMLLLKYIESKQKISNSSSYSFGEIEY